MRGRRKVRRRKMRRSMRRRRRRRRTRRKMMRRMRRMRRRRRSRRMRWRGMKWRMTKSSSYAGTQSEVEVRTISYMKVNRGKRKQVVGEERIGMGQVESRSEWD